MLVNVPEQSREIADPDAVGGRRRESLIHFLVEAAIGLLFGISSATGVDAHARGEAAGDR